MDAVDQPTTFRMTRRRWIILHVVLILLIGYVSSYFYISRLRFQQWGQVQVISFLYIAPVSLANDPEETWRIKHGLLAWFYTPINKVDQEVFGAPGPMACLLTGIGEKKK